MEQLPVPRSAANVKAGGQSNAVARTRGQATTALAQYHKLQAALNDYLRCLAPTSTYDPNTATSTHDARSAEQRTAAAQEQVGKLPALRAQWKLACQPSERDAIATHIFMLVGAFPNQRRADLDLFGQIAITEIAAMRPSAFVLTRACSRVQSSCEFLSLAALVKEIEQARKYAQTTQGWLKSNALAAKLAKEQEQREHDEQQAKLAEAAAAKQEEQEDWDSWLAGIENDPKLIGLPAAIARKLAKHYSLTPDAPWRRIHTLARDLRADPIWVRRALEVLEANGLRINIEDADDA